MIAVWSDEQRDCLEALGYSLYRRATTDGLETTVEASPAPVAGVQMAGQSQGKAAAGKSSGPTDPLLRALLQAADLDPARIDDTTAWLRAQQIPSLTALRNNPASKRALWPRLRALRRDTPAR